MPAKNPKHKRRSGLPKNLEELGKGKLPGKKKKICDVSGCSEPSVHSLSLMEYESYMKKIGMKLKEVRGRRRFNICKKHYKKLKTVKKKEDKILKPRFEFSKGPSPDKKGRLL